VVLQVFDEALSLNPKTPYVYDFFLYIYRVGCGGELNVRRERDGSSQSVLVGTTKEVRFPVFGIIFQVFPSRVGDAIFLSAYLVLMKDYAGSEGPLPTVRQVPAVR
jgi:hypothetical protein